MARRVVVDYTDAQGIRLSLANYSPLFHAFKVIKD